MKNSGLKKLFSLVWPYRGTLIPGLIFLAIGSGINLLFPEIVRRLLNNQSSNLIAEKPVLIGSGLILLFALQGVCFFFRSYLFNKVGHLTVANLRQRLYDSLIYQSIEFYDRERVGDLVSRLTSDIQLIQEAVSTRISVFLRYSLQVAVGIVLMAVLSIKLTLLLVVALPVLVATAMTIGKKLRVKSRLQQEKLGQASAIAEETFSAIRVVKAFGSESNETSRFNSSIDESLSAGISRSKIAAFLSSFVSFLMNLTIVVVMVYGVLLIDQNVLSVGDLTAFILYGLIVAISFSFVANGYGEFMQGIGAIDRVLELLDGRAEISAGADKDWSGSSNSGEAELNNVTFAYASRPEQPVLKELSLKIEAGKITALVGPSGAGKSSIVSLLLGFYKPQSGEVLFEGVPVGRDKLAQIRSRIALVPQEPQLFGLSIMDNLRYGNPEATQEEIEKACSEAYILDFINELPEGFNTFVGSRGVQLSGGQRQRIAIARALLKNPELLILDEATSALDSESEHKIQQALEQVLKNRTALVIAHRLSTIQNADKVIVLEDGQIVQTGDHQSLSSKEGLYKTLVDHQALLVSQ